MKIDQAVCADVGRKPSTLFMKYPIPDTAFIPWGSLCMRKHNWKPPQHNIWPETGQLDRSYPLSVCPWEKYKNKTIKDNEGKKEDATENERERDKRYWQSNKLCPVITVSYRVTLCSQNGDQCSPGKILSCQRKIHSDLKLSISWRSMEECTHAMHIENKISCLDWSNR